MSIEPIRLLILAASREMTLQPRKATPDLLVPAPPAQEAHGKEAGHRASDAEVLLYKADSEGIEHVCQLVRTGEQRVSGSDLQSIERSVSVDAQADVLDQSRRIQYAVNPNRVNVECSRPYPPKLLMSGSQRVRGHSHPDWAGTGQIHDLQRPC
jgi:hypothetical protein